MKTEIVAVCPNSLDIKLEFLYTFIIYMNKNLKVIVINLYNPVFLLEAGKVNR